MHEFSIAMDIVDIATTHAERENATTVTEVEIEVGELSGIVLDALEFALESAVKGTVLEGAERKIISIPGKARCTQCFHEYPASDPFRLCPSCRNCAPDIVEGRELRVKSIVVD